MIDLAALSSAVFARLSSDSAGATLRAALGASAASVLMVEDLRVEGLTVQALPARPIVALRRGAVPVSDQRIMYTPLYTWYCYDDPAIGYGRLETLPALIGAAYAGGLAVGTVAIGADIYTTAGAQTRDANLNLLLQLVTVQIGAV